MNAVVGVRVPSAASRAGSERAWRAIAAAARAPYRRAGHYAWHFAGGKLRGDPLYRTVLERGLIAPGANVLDLGCGQGLLASVLRAAADEARAGRWPSAWAAAPTGVVCTGIEKQARDAERARAALGAGTPVICADLHGLALPPADTIVMFDVLHYLDPAAQDALLVEARRALHAGGALLLRIGDARSSARHAVSRGVDRLVMALRGSSARPLSSRPLDQWLERLQALGLETEARAMPGAFSANVLIVARLAAAAAAPRPGR